MENKIAGLSEISNFFNEISEHLRHENRFSLPENLQRAVDIFCEYHYKHAITIPTGAEYWRARINPMGKIDAYESSDIGAPPKGSASSGRINPLGIRYLYVASNKATAISEVRPWKGAMISVANFVLKEDVKIVDLVQDISLPASMGSNSDAVIETLANDMILKSINAKYFSTPAHAHDDYAYLPSQYIAEKLKIMGIQGIKYPSVLSESGYNICLFLPDKAEFKISEVINVKGVSYTFK